ncbi:MAG: DUF364 domain-containing protein [Candidatus Cloacimonadota bacterium]|nr:DUF364 domain-containing protein [Candidatus Cloacimonadota bacterium]
MIEPLELLYNKYDFEIDNIKKIVTGSRYTALLLNDGHIGVCANLGHIVKTEKNIYSNLNLKNFSHRIVLNAYYNAILNYSGKYKTGDIFEKVNFKTFNNIVMIGLFKPIVEIFQKNNIPLKVFDYKKNDNVLTSMSEQQQILKKTDAVILTSTSIFNLTFMDLIKNINDNCNIFMLGPSSIMAKEVLQYKNIKMIFGSTFDKFDDRVLKIIDNDGGTRKFLKLGQKRIAFYGENR